MAVSKVVLGNQTVMDITDSTVDAGSLLAGKKAYGANGEAVNGSLVVSDRIRWNEAKTSVKKNLIPNKATTQTINGITFTVNSDGSVLVNGTNTASDWATTFEISTTLLEAGEYYVSQSYSSEGAVIFLRLRVNNASGTSIKELGNKSQDSFTLSNDTNVYCDIQIRPNGVVNNVVIKPMIRLSTIEDDTYVPYIPDNVELDVYAKDMEFYEKRGFIEKNLLPYPYESDKTYTTAGITFTCNSDGSVTANGTATNNTTYNLFINKNNILKGGKYKLLGCPSGGASNKYRVHVWNVTKSTTGANDFGSGASLEVDDGDNISCVLNIFSGQTVSNLIFRPMIIPDRISDNTFVGAAMTNRQLTAKVEDLDYYLEQTATTSTTDPTVYTFTDARITADSVIDVYADIFGVYPSSVVASAGTCTVTFPKQDTAQSMTCRIYIK